MASLAAPAWHIDNCRIADSPARGGFKHHTSVGMGHMKAVLHEAFTTYLGYDVISIDER